ncbi:hypothetical protein [Nocardia sienata]|uniref:hypothetical protein n=1 Tax=Nocardia sienata TaxID=248552 RepID=UPI0007A3AD65|nr:hypothetical protein [Nocardia sienata]
MVPAGKLAVVVVATALSVSAPACVAQNEPGSAVNRHEGVAGCIRWWWTDSEASAATTTIHWHNNCPGEVKLVVSWRNHRTNMNPDDVLYGIPGGGEGSDTWAGIPISFRQL